MNAKDAIRRLNQQARRNINTHDGVDSYMSTEIHINEDSEYYFLNFMGEDTDEADDEYSELTVVEPDGVLETARFLNGYDVL